MAGERAPVNGFDPGAHWESVYRTKRIDEVSWFQREPAVSLGLIRKYAPITTAQIIDVGGGASSLVDTLVTAGYSAVTVLDLAPTALARASDRMGPRAARASWIASDALTATLPPAASGPWTWPKRRCGKAPIRPRR